MGFSLCMRINFEIPPPLFPYHLLSIMLSVFLIIIYVVGLILYFVLIVGVVL